MTLPLGHCFTKDDSFVPAYKYINLYFGASDLPQITGPVPIEVFQIQRRTIKKVLIHPNYSWPNSYADISIIGIAFFSPIFDSLLVTRKYPLRGFPQVLTHNCLGPSLAGAHTWQLLLATFFDLMKFDFDPLRGPQVPPDPQGSGLNFE
jgi:hypothetical protein